jgi:hypothetical protein
MGRIDVAGAAQLLKILVLMPVGSVKLKRRENTPSLEQSSLAGVSS